MTAIGRRHPGIGTRPPFSAGYTTTAPSPNLSSLMTDGAKALFANTEDFGIAKVMMQREGGYYIQ